jgi:hypothetical protein
MGTEMYISWQQKRRKYVDHVLADQCLAHELLN